MPLLGHPPPRSPYPELLAELAPARWRICARFSLDYAAKHAQRADAVGVAGQAAVAILEEAHARACERRQWVVNEKGLVVKVGLQTVQARFAALPRTAAELARWVDELAAELALV